MKSTNQQQHEDKDTVKYISTNYGLTEKKLKHKLVCLIKIQVKHRSLEINIK